MKLSERISCFVYRWVIDFLRRGVDDADSREMGIDPTQATERFSERRISRGPSSGDLQGGGFDSSGLTRIANEYLPGKRVSGNVS